jgi:Relaxase/Mobilisation nuclease domain.
MLCKIVPHAANVFAAVNYNERKAKGIDVESEKQNDKDVEGIEEGMVLATRNVGEGRTLTEEFDELKMIRLKKGTGRKFKNFAFHMSVNPKWDTDKPLTDEKYVELIDRVMEGLGYADQPYRIYKHMDIERAHFHVVSIRTDKNARGISDSFEHLKLRSILRALKDEYGYELYYEDENNQVRKDAEENEESIKTIVEERTKRKEDKKKPEEKKAYVPSFDPKSETGTMDQIRNAVEDTFNWNFSTFEQWQALLQRRYNVLVVVQRKNEEEDTLVFFGTNKDGTARTPPLDETALGLNLRQRLSDKCSSSNMRNRKEQKKRIEELAVAAAEVSGSYKEFVQNMEKKGAYMYVSFNSEGQPFGLTYLDRRTKCAWKGSETATDLKWLMGIAQTKGWTISQDKYQIVASKHARMPSRKKTYNMSKQTDTPPIRTQSDAGRGPIRLPAIKAPHHQASTADVTRGRSRDDILDELERERERNKEKGVDN